ncbi:hypothetical protein J5N97_022310 [Dioscorea zingiberensis]|uniref:Uncharacterized protein n=1 Tax=Dioscorea zingiberensis TaxID=325984 RepID=A0A9D5CA54_9LILI|nr:hypothetical protein J5N97_022310 [Dioscorea zingiberensis]
MSGTPTGLTRIRAPAALQAEARLQSRAQAEVAWGQLLERRPRAAGGWRRAGPHGQQIVILDVDEDYKVQEQIKKSEVVEASRAAAAAVGSPVAVDQQHPQSQSEVKNHHLLEHKG